MIPIVALVLAFHLLVGLVTMVVVVRRERLIAPAILPVMLGLSGGPVGVCIALALAALIRWFPGRAPGGDWATLLGGRGSVSDRRLVDRVCDNRVRHPSRAELGSFYDIQCFGSVAMRQRVVATVVRAFEPALAPVIARALTDPDQSVRAQAAAAATDFQNSFTARRKALEARAVVPGDDAARVELAMLLANNAQVVLFSDQVRATLLAEAMAALTGLRDSGEASPALDRRLAGLLLIGNQPAAALDLLAADPAANDATYLCRFEALFRLGDFDALRAACIRLRAVSSTISPRLTRIVEFWGQETAGV